MEKKNVDFESLLKKCENYDERGLSFISELLFNLKGIHIIAQPAFSMVDSNDLFIHRVEDENGNIKLRGWSFNIYWFDIVDKTLHSNIICKPGEGILGDVYTSKTKCIRGALKFLLDNHEFYKIF